MQGILLIGMPGAGKSSLGRKVAGLLGFGFFDGDAEIEKEHPDRQRFLDKYGDEAYIRMEEKIILALPIENSVLSPGGSMVYSRKCREQLRPCYKVFLDASLETIERRLKNADKRAIIYLKKKSVKALYEERKRLYKKYADVTFDTEKKNEDELARKIVAAYKARQNG
jgi:shikimate kinase